MTGWNVIFLVIKGDAEKVAIAFNIMSDVILIVAIRMLLTAQRNGSKRHYGKIGGILGVAGGE